MQRGDISALEFRKLRICCPNCYANRSDSCPTCNGTGIVCPECTGARWLAKHRPGEGSLMERCSKCGFWGSEGWEYDENRETAAIERWLDDWVNGRLPEPELEEVPF